MDFLKSPSNFSFLPLISWFSAYFNRVLIELSGRKMVRFVSSPLVVEKLPLIIGILPLIIEKLPLIIRKLPLIIEKLPLIIGKLPLIIEKLPLTIENLPLKAKIKYEVKKSN
jgi:hypothetical protein